MSAEVDLRTDVVAVDLRADSTTTDTRVDEHLVELRPEDGSEITLRSDVVRVDVRTGDTHITEAYSDVVHVVEIASGALFSTGGLTSVDWTARDSTTPTLCYFANSSAAEGSEDPTAAEWQIARIDSTQDPLAVLWAGGNQTFNKVLDSGAKEFEGYSYS